VRELGGEESHKRTIRHRAQESCEFRLTVARLNAPAPRSLGPARSTGSRQNFHPIAQRRGLLIASLEPMPSRNAGETRPARASHQPTTQRSRLVNGATILTESWRGPDAPPRVACGKRCARLARYSSIIPISHH